MLVTLAQAKLQIGLTDTDDDTLLTRIIRGVSSRIGRACGRVLPNGLPCLEYAASLTEIRSILDYSQDMLRLRCWPIVSVTSVVESLYGDWDAGDSLTEGDDFHVDTDRGVLWRIGSWLRGNRSVRVIYAGGYTPAEAWVSAASYSAGDPVKYLGAIYAAATTHTGQTTAPDADDTNWTVQAGQVALPYDLVDAALLQVTHEYNRKGSIGATGQSVQGGSVSWTGEYKLLQEVRDVCTGYARKR